MTGEWVAEAPRRPATHPLVPTNLECGGHHSGLLLADAGRSVAMDYADSRHALSIGGRAVSPSDITKCLVRGTKACGLDPSLAVAWCSTPVRSVVRRIAIYKGLSVGLASSPFPCLAALSRRNAASGEWTAMNE